MNAKRFHISPELGEPRLCRAQLGGCPYGGAENHYATEGEARAAYEANKETFQKINIYEDIPTEELQKLEEKTLLAHRQTGEPLSDEEFARHYELVQRLRKELPSTHKLHTHKVKGKVVYTDERLAQHEELVAKMAESYSHIPKEGKALMLGGITGSGKTTVLKQLGLTNSVVVNVDDTKVWMIQEGLTPEIKGILPLESDDLIKHEANVITKKFFEKVVSEKFNLILDKSMAGEKPIRDEISYMKENGYDEVKSIFVDVDPAVALKRTKDRHRNGINKWIATGEGYGERPIAEGAITGTLVDNPHFKSKNAMFFYNVAKDNLFNETTIFDTTNSIPGEYLKPISLDKFTKGL